MHRLAGVQVEDVADPVAQAQRVWSRLGEARRLEAVELGTRCLEPAPVGLARARVVHLLGHAGAKIGPELLPLAGEHAVPLQIAEPAVIGNDLEAITDRLPAASGAVAPVRALARQISDQLRALDRVERVDAAADRNLPAPADS